MKISAPGLRCQENGRNPAIVSFNVYTGLLKIMIFIKKIKKSDLINLNDLNDFNDVIYITQQLFQ